MEKSKGVYPGSGTGSSNGRIGLGFARSNQVFKQNVELFGQQVAARTEQLKQGLPPRKKKKVEDEIEREPHIGAPRVLPPSPVYGCMDPLALNYNPLATVSDGSCTYDPPPPVYGCTDPVAINYNPLATVYDGSCIYSSAGLTFWHYIVGWTASPWHWVYYSPTSSNFDVYSNGTRFSAYSGSEVWFFETFSDAVNLTNRIYRTIVATEDAPEPVFHPDWFNLGIHEPSEANPDPRYWWIYDNNDFIIGVATG